MRLTNQALLLSAAAVVLVSCSDDNPWKGQAGMGGIHLELTADGNVKDAIPVLRSGSTAPDVPDASEFSIVLTKTSDGQETRYESIEKFNSTESFSVGGYTLAAEYGTSETEGFESPYYYGSTSLTVLEERETNVEVTAKLASTMLSIDYTDAFTTYFKAYSVTAHSEGHSYVDFGAAETRPAYLQPGDISLTVHVTNQSGKSVDLQPAAFPAESAHHYHVTLDVNEGNVGQAQLVITFDDTLDKDDVTVDLTDELFTSAAPTITPTGFADGDRFETVESSTLPDVLKYNITAPAGFSKVVLTIAGEGFSSTFGNEIDLCAATPAQQEELRNLGIEARGLYGKTDKFASVDITGLPVHLPAGTYTVSLVAHDQFTRVSDPVSVVFTSVPVVFEMSAGNAVINSNRATLTVDYNGDINDVTFQAMDKHGVYKDCEILSSRRNKRTRSAETYTYTFEISLPDTDRPKVPVKVFLSGKEKLQFDVEIVAPAYGVRADGFSTYAAIKIEPEDAGLLSLVTNTVGVFVNNSAVAESRLTRNPETGVIVISGLNPSTSYSLHTSLYADGSASGEALNFTTEGATQLSNGDFSETKNTINMTDVNVGGLWTGTALSKPTYQSVSSIVINEPAGWASINGKTCWAGASNVNTWFCVPSTYAENGAVVLRNVGYNHNGATPGVYSSTARYYNGNAPSFGAGLQAAGELFLGSYSFNGSENRSEGIDFNCRPTSLTFDYKYAPVNNDVAAVTIEAVNATGAVIAQGSSVLNASDSYKNVEVKLTGYTFGAKASSIRVRFVSSTNPTPPVNIPSGSSLNDGCTYTKRTVAANQYKSVATGSVLTLDNVKFNY